MAFIIIYVTHSSEEAAAKLSNQLLKEKMIACANSFPIQSAYWWKDAITHDAEWVSILKTTSDRWNIVQKRVEDLHPYEVPCVMKIEVEANEAYEEWIRSSVEC